MASRQNTPKEKKKRKYLKDRICNARIDIYEVFLNGPPHANY